MTTKKQIQTLLALLTTRNEDLAAFGYYVVIKPVRHVFCTISIDRTSSADVPQFLWSIGHLFTLSTSWQGLWLERILFEPGRLTLWSDPDMPARFLSTVEAQILPRLRQITTIQAMLDCDLPLHYGYDRALDHPFRQIQIDAALGRFEEALVTCRMLAAANQRKTGLGSEAAYSAVMDELRPLIETGDHAAVARLLHEWEARTVQRLGFEAIWEPSPFPLELQSSA